MLEKLLVAEVLEVRVLHTALAQNLVGEVVGAGSLASRRARIINTASAARQDATLDFGDLQSAKNFEAMKATMQLPVYA
jgi:hypothetical protein